MTSINDLAKICAEETIPLSVVNQLHTVPGLTKARMEGLVNFLREEATSHRKASHHVFGHKRKRDTLLAYAKGLAVAADRLEDSLNDPILA